MITQIILTTIIVGGWIYALTSLDKSRHNRLHNITIEARGTDYMAYLNDDKKLWGCGRTIDEAIGSGIRSHYDLLDSPITYPWSIPN